MDDLKKCTKKLDVTSENSTLNATTAVRSESLNVTNER